MLEWFCQKIKIGRNHLAAFRIILLFSNTYTLSVCTKGILYRNNKTGNTQSTMFAERVYHLNGIYSQENYQMCEGWRKDFKLKVVWKKKYNRMTHRVNFIAVFLSVIQPYHSRMLFPMEVFCGLVQQLPAGLWVIQGTREIQKDRPFVNMGYTFDTLLCWLLIKLYISMLRMLLIPVSLLLNYLMPRKQKLSQQVWIHSYITKSDPRILLHLQMSSLDKPGRIVLTSYSDWD